MDLVVGTSDDGNVKMVPGEYLVRLVDVSLSFCQVFGLREVVVNLSDVYLWNPTICVDDGEKDLFWVDTGFVEELLLEVLGAPRYITSFPSLLILPQQVPSVPHSQEPVPELVD